MNKQLRNISTMLRSHQFLKSAVSDRCAELRKRGYTVERVRHYGAKVGDIHQLVCGEIRVAIDAPRGKYRTAWSIIFKSFGNIQFYI